MIINQKPEERLDDLQIKGYKILQNPGRFCFRNGCGALICICRCKEE